MVSRISLVVALTKFFTSAVAANDSAIFSDWGNNSTIDEYDSYFSSAVLTRDVSVKPLHSHNDYWRSRPLFDALAAGAQSVEADVWLLPSDVTVKWSDSDETESFDSDEIYVGHDASSLNSDATLDALYLDPIFDFLQASNPTFELVDDSVFSAVQYTNTSTYGFKNVSAVSTGSSNSSSNSTAATSGAVQAEYTSKNGLFYDSGDAPLYLWFDIKTEANDTYDALLDLVQRFIDNEFLAYFDVASGEYIPGPLVLTVTGNLPFEKVVAEEKRYIFLDAPLEAFSNGTTDDVLSNWNGLSVAASGSLESLLGESYAQSKRKDFDNQQKFTLTQAIDKAHGYNLKTRVWGDITWPLSLSKSHLTDLWSLGSDFLNVDDLEWAVKEL